MFECVNPAQEVLMSYSFVNLIFLLPPNDEQEDEQANF